MDLLKGSREFETVRLRLRRFNPGDADSFFKNYSADKENYKYYTGIQYTFDRTLELVIKWSEQQIDNFKYRWAIELKSCSEVIGLIVISIIDSDKRFGEISFGIGKKYWGRGLMPEAVQAVIAYSVSELKLKKIISAFDTKNVNVGRVLKKCGMIYEKTIIEERQNDSVLYYIYKYEP